MFKKLVVFFQGRHTLFVAWFALSGLGLSLIGKLTGPYVGLCSVLVSAVFAHSVKEDYFAKRNDDGTPAGDS